MRIRVGDKYQHLVSSAGCACCAPELGAITHAMNKRESGLSRREALAGIAAAAASLGLPASAQTTAPEPSRQARGVLFEDVRIFNGSGSLTPPSSVLVLGDRIRGISRGPTAAPTDIALTRINGGGRTLMPGLIDAHVHVMFEALPQVAILTGDISFITVAALRTASDMLMRGYTSVRDLGGPVLGVKRGIDQGLAPGPRIWPSGAFISQTGGHGDFRLPNDMPAAPGSFTFSERVGAAAIADSPDLVRQRAREQLALGASQLKLMAGGGVSSHYDPLDVTQYTVPELRAAVEAAENWGTYVTVHAYTPRAVRQAIEAGVRCIEHGQLLDEATVALMNEKGLWWSLQPFTEDAPTAFAEGSPNRLKQLEMFAGTENAYALAKKFGIRVAWGTDILFDPKASARRPQDFLKMTRWYAPAEILRMATAENAALLALSGPRNPYPGKIGVIEQDALADLLLVDGDPIRDIELLGRPESSLKVIMKGGAFVKNTLP